MKIVGLFFFCGLLFLGIPTFSEISVEEFEKIRAIIKEEVGESETRLHTEIVASEKRLRAEIAASEKRTMTHTTHEVAKLTVRMDETDKRRDTQFASVDRNFGYVFMLFVALLALIGLPLLRDWKKEREQDAKLAAQQKRLESQEKRIEAQARELKAQEKRIEAQNRELETIRNELSTLKQGSSSQPQGGMHRDPEVSPTATRGMHRDQEGTPRGNQD